MKKHLCMTLFICSTVLMGGCAVSADKALLETNGAEQLKLRQIQTRYFDTADKKKTMESIMATLQDLGFIIDKASLDIGTITATKLKGYKLRMTVSVFPRGTDKMTVRANGQFGITPIESPVLYQQFFDSLSKSMFLQAHTED